MLPKKIKKTLPLIPQKTLIDRRRELLEDIQRNGTYLPRGVEHADIDRSMLDYVRDELKIVADGKVVPTVDVLISTQNWSQFTETWNFNDLDKNIKPPFVVTIRKPEVPYGTNPSLQYTIPNRREFTYLKVPTWDGQRKGADVYMIPQPIPVDVTFDVKIFCNKMRHLNKFNKVVLQKFSSRQSYLNIKGHYMPVILNNISDESKLDLEKRKYYVQTYNFTVLGFILDEEEFVVKPAISRGLTLYEVDTNTIKGRVNNGQANTDKIKLDILYSSGVTSLSETYHYTCDLNVNETDNISDYSVYINGTYVGDNLPLVQVNTNDFVEINVVKIDNNLDANINATLTLL